MTLHNFSFRNDPLNAPKGQEVIRAIDEVVNIFPSPPKLVHEPKVAPLPIIVPKVPTAPPPAPAPAPSTSLTPALPSGLLKVKMFGKMKERNTFDSPPSTNDKPESQMEIDDDEDFDLETPHTSKTQSLGNSGVTITPISHLNKGKQRKETSLGVGVNIHMPSSSLELTKKVKIMPAVTRCVYLNSYFKLYICRSLRSFLHHTSSFHLASRSRGHVRGFSATARTILLCRDVLVLLISVANQISMIDVY